MDRFDTSVSLLISAIVGAGVFAMPALANETSLLSLIIIPLAFLYMLGVGELIIEMFPGTVEEEVEKFLGERGKQILLVVEHTIIFLALTAYAIGLRTHLGLSHIMVLSLLAIPLALELHLTSHIMYALSFFVLGFVSFLSLISIPRMEVPHSIAGIFSNLNFSGVVPLFFVSIFAFYGHNLIPRIRNIMRSKEKTQNVVRTSIATVFLLYLPFAVAVGGMGASGLATKFLAQYFVGNLGMLIDLFAAIVFYTSFILYGLHMAQGLGEWGAAHVFGSVFILYSVAAAIGANFVDIVAAAGISTSIYGGIIALAGLKKNKKLSIGILSATLLSWLIFLLEFV